MSIPTQAPIAQIVEQHHGLERSLPLSDIQDFADATRGLIATLDPCVLVVEFRLRAVRGLGHAAFRRESLLNTPLFAGFPGFVSKLWLADDERCRYRGFYEWDDPGLAERLLKDGTPYRTAEEILRTRTDN